MKTHRLSDHTFLFGRVSADPPCGVGITAILRHAFGGHHVARFSRETVPARFQDSPVALRVTARLFGVVLVPVSLGQVSVGSASVNWQRRRKRRAGAESLSMSTLSLPRVINSKFPCSLTRNITSWLFIPFSDGR